MIVTYLPFGWRTPPRACIHWSPGIVTAAARRRRTATRRADVGARVAVVVLGALVGNARMLALTGPRARSWPGRWQWAAAYGWPTAVYALATTRAARPGGT